MAFESPIIVHNYMQFGLLRQKFNTNVVVVYCDPAVQGYKTYQQILKSISKTRKNKPINIKPNADGEVSKK